jgi:hypothetical protein
VSLGALQWALEEDFLTCAVLSLRLLLPCAGPAAA